jgi:hypothetical protein
MGDLQLPLSDAFNLAFSGYRLSNMSRIILIFNMESIEAGEDAGRGAVR